MTPAQHQKAIRGLVEALKRRDKAIKKLLTALDDRGVDVESLAIEIGLDLNYDLDRENAIPRGMK